MYAPFCFLYSIIIRIFARCIFYVYPHKFNFVYKK